MKRLLIAFLFIAPFISFSQDKIPDKLPNTYVNDYAGVLSQAQTLQLNERLLQLDTQKTVQLFVVIVKELPDISIEEYALGIGRKWHVGNGQNGSVYVCVTGTHSHRLEVGERLSGVLPDIKSLDILKDVRLKYRETNDYSQGINLLIDEINTALTPEEVADQKNNVAEYGKKDSGNGMLILIIIIVIIVVFVVGSIVYLKYKDDEEDDEEATGDPVYPIVGAARYPVGGGYSDTENNIPPVYTPNFPPAPPSVYIPSSDDESSSKKSDEVTSSKSDDDSSSSKSDDDDDDKFGKSGGSDEFEGAGATDTGTSDGW